MRGVVREKQRQKCKRPPLRRPFAECDEQGALGADLDRHERCGFLEVKDRLDQLTLLEVLARYLEVPGKILQLIEPVARQQALVVGEPGDVGSLDMPIRLSLTGVAAPIVSLASIKRRDSALIVVELALVGSPKRIITS